MWNGFAFWITPLIVVVALVLLAWRGKSLMLALFFFAGLPLGPSMAVKHLFPGVFIPPDPAHNDPIPTLVETRPDAETPAGIRRQAEVS